MDLPDTKVERLNALSFTLLFGFFFFRKDVIKIEFYIFIAIFFIFDLLKINLRIASIFD